MKKILIDAYTNLNLGDDLFIEILANRYKNTKFYLFTNFDYNKFKVAQNLYIIRYNFIKKIIKLICRVFKISPNYLKSTYLKKAHGIIEIGGSLFIEEATYKTVLNERQKNLEQVNGNYFILGSNFGPYFDNDYLIKYKTFFSKCRDVCFRETFSYNLFKDLENIRVAKDIVFSMDVEKSDENNYVLYSIIKPSKKGIQNRDEEYYKKIRSTTIDLIKNGKKIKYMSFCKFEGDEEAIQEILSKIPNEYLKQITTYNYLGNLKEALNIIKKSEIIIATRFHAIILGFIFEKKTLPIAYSRKIINVLEDLKFEGDYIEFDALKKLNLSTIEKSKKINQETIRNIQKNSLKHFEKLDLYLNSDNE